MKSWIIQLFDIVFKDYTTKQYLMNLFALDRVHLPFKLIYVLCPSIVFLKYLLGRCSLCWNWIIIHKSGGMNFFGKLASGLLYSLIKSSWIRLSQRILMCKFFKAAPGNLLNYPLHFSNSAVLEFHL